MIEARNSRSAHRGEDPAERGEKGLCKGGQAEHHEQSSGAHPARAAQHVHRFVPHDGQANRARKHRQANGTEEAQQQTAVLRTVAGGARQGRQHDSAQRHEQHLHRFHHQVEGLAVESQGYLSHERAHQDLVGVGGEEKHQLTEGEVTAQVEHAANAGVPQHPLRPPRDDPPTEDRHGEELDILLRHQGPHSRMHHGEGNAGDAAENLCAQTDRSHRTQPHVALQHGLMLGAQGQQDRGAGQGHGDGTDLRIVIGHDQPRGGRYRVESQGMARCGEGIEPSQQRCNRYGHGSHQEAQKLVHPEEHRDLIGVDLRLLNGGHVETPGNDDPQEIEQRVNHSQEPVGLRSQQAIEHRQDSERYELRADLCDDDRLGAPSEQVA